MKFLLTALIALLSLLTPVADAAEISGTVIDSEQKPVAKATVVLCDHETGIPVNRKAYKPFTTKLDLKDIATTVTDSDGRFAFQDIPDGQYRLITQSWKDTPAVKDIFEKNGTEIILHGVTDKISVPGKEATNIKIAPLGTAVVTLDEDFPNDANILVISTKPLSTNPIFRFASWQGPFLQHLIGGNRMLRGITTVHGLPEGTLYFSVFSADNNGGIGAAAIETKAGETVNADYIPIVCGWSNGQHTPSKELEPVFAEVKEIYQRDKKILLLYQLLEKKGITVKIPAEGASSLLSVYRPHLQEIVTLPSGRKVRFADVLASVEYIHWQRRMEQRKAKRN
jgi:hypothetical protein